MENIPDDQIAIALLQATCVRFPEVISLRMEKGFHSPANQTALAKIAPSRSSR